MGTSSDSRNTHASKQKLLISLEGFDFIWASISRSVGFGHGHLGYNNNNNNNNNNNIYLYVL